MLALQFFNTYDGEPVIARDEQLQPGQTVTKMFKYTQASWPGLENLSDYLTEDTEGNLTLRSTDDEGIATVTLSANGFQIMCTFLYLLPYKKPQWVEVGDLH